MPVRSTEQDMHKCCMSNVDTKQPTTALEAHLSTKGSGQARSRSSACMHSADPYVCLLAGRPRPYSKVPLMKGSTCCPTAMVAGPLLPLACCSLLVPSSCRQGAPLLSTLPAQNGSGMPCRVSIIGRRACCTAHCTTWGALLSTALFTTKCWHLIARTQAPQHAPCLAVMAGSPSLRP